MRRLALLALVILAAFPLSAHGYGHRRRVVVVEDSCRPVRRWADEWWEHRGYSHPHPYGYRGCDEDRVVFGVRPLPMPRPLAPPLQGRVELWIR